MAETSLRAYIREVDDLIEHEQLDEAIAHARHILQTYPRHLDTYRLLGKAYLEAKRYGDSADILQRVLSAVPDDFVAHVGMSIVREDEGNLDAAIWHMERAFETNPSNAAVQGELRRLIGKRDGLEPHKVRLTRGALARMYAHGELYPQAIAELRAALAEDPHRPDLQVLLAEMYWRTNQRAEAAEVATAILESLPNCREANRIMAAALHAQGRTEEALTYHRRVAALDPYSALVASIQEDPSQVDPNAVRIEKLMWQPGQPLGRDTGPAEWSAGVRAESRPVQTARPTARPSWLDSLSAATAAAEKQARQPEAGPETASPAPLSEPTPAEAAPAEPSPIPDWMQAAGWVPGTGETKEGPVSFSDDELRSLEAGMLPPEPAPEPEGGLARAEIPDWLKDVAPPDVEELAAAAEETPAPAATPRADLSEPHLPPGWNAPAAGTSDDDDWLRAAAGESPAVPTWMEEEAPGATATIVTWLGDRTKPEPAAPEAALPAEPEEAPPAPATLPEWLSEAAPSPGAEPGPQGTEPPGWLSGVAEAAARGTSLAPEEFSWGDEEIDRRPITTGMYPESGPEPEPAQPAELPEWLQTIAGSETGSRAEPRAETAPEWLPRPPAEPEARAAAGDEIGSESFGWLRELAASEPPTPASEAPEMPAPSWLAEPTEGSRAALGRSAGPEWLRGIAEPESKPGTGDTLDMDWLRGIAEPAAQEAAPAPEGPAPEEAGEWLNLLATPESKTDSVSTGEWMRLLKEEGGPPPAEPTAPPVAATPAVSAGELDDAQVFDWLESLAAKQGIPAPEAITAEPPLARVPPMTPAPAPPIRQPAPEIPEEPEAGLKWLEELATAQGTPAAAEVEPAPPTVPSVPAAAATPTAPAVEPPPSAPTAPAPARAEPSPQVPDWLKQLVAETPVAEPAAEEPASPAAETWPSLPEWMVTPQPAEDEPTVPPLPPVSVEAAAAAEVEPIDELAETWVPPWEQLPGEEVQVSPTEAVPPPVEQAARAAPVPETAAEETPASVPEPVVEQPYRYQEPKTDVLEEVPDWLRTPAPRRAARAEPEPTTKEPEPVEELEIPDWLAAPPPQRAAVPTPVAQVPVKAPEPAPTVVSVPPPTPPAAPAEPVEPVAAMPVEAGPAPSPLSDVTEVRSRVPVPPPLPAATSARRAPARAPRPKAATQPSLEERLEAARQALATGDFRRAAGAYSAVIKKKYNLAQVTSELELALDRYPKAGPLWQALGDAYMKEDRLQDAIAAYERGIAAA